METEVKGTDLSPTAGKEDAVELCGDMEGVVQVGDSVDNEIFSLSWY